MGYEFEPTVTAPPVGPHLLQHLYENPHHAEVLPVLFNRIPKKMQTRLLACPKKGLSTGWGIQFVESLDLGVIFMSSLMEFLILLVVSLVYTVAKQDVQGGFTIGAFLLTFFLFL